MLKGGLLASSWTELHCIRYEGRGKQSENPSRYENAAMRMTLRECRCDYALKVLGTRATDFEDLKP